MTIQAVRELGRNPVNSTGSMSTQYSEEAGGVWKLYSYNTCVGIRHFWKVADFEIRHFLQSGGIGLPDHSIKSATTKKWRIHKSATHKKWRIQKVADLEKKWRIHKKWRIQKVAEKVADSKTSGGFIKSGGFTASGVFPSLSAACSPALDMIGSSSPSCTLRQNDSLLDINFAPWGSELGYSQPRN